MKIGERETEDSTVIAAATRQQKQRVDHQSTTMICYGVTKHLLHGGDECDTKQTRTKRIAKQNERMAEQFFKNIDGSEWGKKKRLNLKNSTETGA